MLSLGEVGSESQAKLIFSCEKEITLLAINQSTGVIIMALLNAKKKSKKIPILFRVDEVLVSEIKAYSEWVGIERLDDFFEQAARYILEKDKDWQKKAGQFSPEQLSG